MTVEIKHGTTAGYRLEVYRGLTTCDECKAANSAAMREARKKPHNRRKTRAMARARGRALVRLSHLYPDVYQTLYAEELPRARAEVKS